MRIKICCIASAMEAKVAIAAGAELIGLVGAMPSGPGVIDEAAMAEIVSAVGTTARTVRLTSAETAEEIADQAARSGVDAVQIVRHLPPAELRRLRRAMPGREIVQVVHVVDETAIDTARAYADIADMLLLDSGRPAAVVQELGGTGRTHDWRISRRIVENSPRPVLLAGGLAADNVAAAIATVRPAGVDVCSGVRQHGQLDAARLAAFMSSVHGTAAT